MRTTVMMMRTVLISALAIFMTSCAGSASDTADKTAPADITGYWLCYSTSASGMTAEASDPVRSVAAHRAYQQCERTYQGCSLAECIQQ
ncbi:hypothetical protein [Pseudidiomarina sp.]|uniref:hypothetical protein n=1 Tax=Pseudidiomarina sp. TaxID=2081707 RepID=UPI00299E0CD3|nr:hypothetical protein [Pseudidiomarina sp.]MDX1706202.1 hypothetical protein [Pseudidiomarina sp.]